MMYPWRWRIGLACALACAVGAGASTAAAEDPPAPTAGVQLKLPTPAWLTDELRAEISAAGVTGRDMPEDLVLQSCPGVGPLVPGVQAGMCLVDPAGCTANYVFYNGPMVSDAAGRLRPAGPNGLPALPPFTSDGQTWFLGSAGHCLGGREVLGQIRSPGMYLPDNDAGGIAVIGATHKKMDAGVGKDFGTIQIRKGHLVTPANPIGAPMGIATMCVPAPVDYYGHGYHFAVAQGKGGGGGAFFPASSWFTWAGTTFGGDSGSGVSLPTLAAAGNLTHGLGIANGLVPLPIGYGTRMTRILDFLGRGFHLVNADGTLVRETAACNGIASPWDPLIR